MPKSKEFSKPHAAMQREETPSIVSQIPKEHMGAAIRELVEIDKARRARRKQPTGEQCTPTTWSSFAI